MNGPFIWPYSIPPANELAIDMLSTAKRGWFTRAAKKVSELTDAALPSCNDSERFLIE